MFSRQEIIARSELVRDCVNMVLNPQGISVDKIYLVGSYASNRADDRSDIDYLVLVMGGKRAMTFPNWKEIEEINQKIDNPRIHVIFSVDISAQESLRKKDPVRFAYRLLEQKEKTHASINSPVF